MIRFMDHAEQKCTLMAALDDYWSERAIPPDSNNSVGWTRLIDVFTADGDVISRWYCAFAPSSGQKPPVSTDRHSWWLDGRVGACVVPRRPIVVRPGRKSTRRWRFYPNPDDAARRCCCCCTIYTEYIYPHFRCSATPKDDINKEIANYVRLERYSRNEICQFKGYIGNLKREKDVKMPLAQLWHLFRIEISTMKWILWSLNCSVSSNGYFRCFNWPFELGGWTANVLTKHGSVSVLPIKSNSTLKLLIS